MTARPASGAAYAASVLSKLVPGNDPPQFERGTVDAAGRLAPDSWQADPFYPLGSQPDGMHGFDMAWHLKPGQNGEDALVGVTINGTSVQHAHPTRSLQPGDRVLLVWASGIPVVLEIL